MKEEIQDYNSLIAGHGWNVVTSSFMYGPETINATTILKDLRPGTIIEVIKKDKKELFLIIEPSMDGKLLRLASIDNGKLYLSNSTIFKDATIEIKREIK